MYKESKKPNLKVHFLRAHPTVKGCKYWGLSVYGRWGIFIVSAIPAFTPDFGLHHLIYMPSTISHHRSRSWCYRSWCVCKSLYHVTRPHDHYKFKFSLYVSWILQYIFNFRYYSLKIHTYYKNWLIIEIPSYAGLILFSVYRDRCPGTTEKLSIAKALRFLNNVLKRVLNDF